MPLRETLLSPRFPHRTWLHTKTFPLPSSILTNVAIPSPSAFYSLSYFLSDHFIPITGAAFTLVTVFLFFRRKRKRKQGIQTLHDQSTDSKQTTSALMKELAGCGEIIGETKLPNQTWREFLIALRKGAQIPEFFEEVVAYHYRVRTLTQILSLTQRQNLQKQLAKWRDSYPKLPT